MAIDVTVPDMGESVIEATVAKWMKKEGDTVRAGEPLVELETDKVNVEVGSQQAGVLARILRAPGENVRVGDVLATVEPSEAGAPAPEAPAPAKVSAGAQTGGAEDSGAEDSEAGRGIEHTMREEGVPHNAEAAQSGEQGDVSSADTPAPPAPPITPHTETGRPVEHTLRAEGVPPVPPPSDAPPSPEAEREARRLQEQGIAAPEDGDTAPAAGPAGGPAGGPAASVPYGGSAKGENAGSSAARGDDSGGTAAAAAAPATPVARRMAEDMGVDLTRVPAQGGRITKSDVQAFVEAGRPAPAQAPAPATPAPAAQPPRSQPAAAPASAAPASVAPAPVSSVPSPAPQSRPDETRERMSRRRQTIARRLVEAQHTAAMLTTFNEIDLSAVMDLRKRRREAFKERFGVDLGYMPFFVKAVVGALKAFPYLNAEIQGEEIVVKRYYDIGIAVGSEEGLVVPVVRGADRLSFAEIEKAIRGFVEKVRAGSLTLEDLRGGTFTITNGGVYGSLLSTPILNPPQVGILGMHKIQERPVIVDGQIVARPMMYVALSYDHRIVDGQAAVQFLVRVKELLEDPETLIFG